MKKYTFLLIALNASIVCYAQTAEESNQSGIEHVWRSSEQAKQVATNRFGRRFSKNAAFKAAEEKLPIGSKRICAICMDNDESPTTGAGACSGHGGVRFWVYKTPSEDSVFLATWRNDEHPEYFTDEERSKLSAYQRYQLKLERKRSELAQFEQNNPNKNLPTAINSFAENATPTNKKDTVYVVMQQPNGSESYTLHWLYISVAFAASAGGALFIRKIVNETQQKPPQEITENKTPMLHQSEQEDDLSN